MTAEGDPADAAATALPSGPGGIVRDLRLAVWLGWLLILCSLTAVFTAFLRGRLPLSLYYNSDILFMPALFRSLMTGGSLLGWQFSRAPYIVPDLPLYFVLNYLTGDFRSAMLAYGVAQVALFTASMVWLCSLAFPGSRSTLVLALISIAACVFSTASGSFAPGTFLLFQNSHFGIVICGVWLAGLVILSLRSNLGNARQIAIQIAIFAVSALSTASDGLFLVQFTAPAALAALALYVTSAISRKSLIATLSSLILSAIVGLLLYPLVALRQTTDQFVDLPDTAIVQSFGQLLQLVKGSFSSGPFATSLWVCFIFVSLVQITAWTRKATSGQPIPPARMFLITLLLSQVLCNGLAAIGTGWTAERYFIPSILFPVWFGWPFLLGGSRLVTGLLSRHYGIYWLLAMTLIAGAPTLPSPAEFASIPTLAAYTPDFVKCLDDRTAALGLKSGIAGYWQARLISMFSHRGLRAAQVRQAAAEPFYWASDRADFTARDYDFVVINTAETDRDFLLDGGRLTRLYGPPANTFQCGADLVLVYNRPTDDAFRTIFEDAPALANFEAPGGRARWLAADLPSRTGRLEGALRAAKPGDPADFLSFGPYVMLPAGDYTFRFGLANATDTDGASKWDVTVTHCPGVTDFTALASGDIPAGPVPELSGQFRLPGRCLTEVRLFYSGKGTLSVASLTISRVK